MRRAVTRSLAGLALFVALAMPLGANPPQSSLIPVQRPSAAPPSPTPTPTAVAGVTRVQVQATALAPRRSLRPQLRAGGVVQTAPAPIAAAAAASTATPPARTERRGLFGGLFRPQGAQADARVVSVRATNLAVGRSLRPMLRPDGLERATRAAATRTTPGRVTQPGRRGSLCGSPGIIGETLDPITGRIRGCGIANPVRVREIDGITLSQPATINCETALATQRWLREGVVPEVGRLGGGVAGLRVVASYSCRSRNNRPGARLSEHASGNAIDIAAIVLASGDQIVVEDDWRSGRGSRVLRGVHRAACGPFGTVLGPDSDAYHQDHFHFDVASYRSGPYCR